MKTLYILILVTFISCGQKTKEEKEIIVKAQDAVEEIIDSSKNVESTSFDKIINEMQTKATPLMESTNFDSFIEEGDYKNVDVRVLKLEKIYPNFYKEGYNYKAIANYKLELSKSFYSVVVTVLKGENEMESTLINYDLNGEIIDSKVISYDEIAEGWSKIESKIDKNIVTVNNIQEIEEKQVETTLFEIEATGKIKPIAKEENHIGSVLKQLNLDISKVKTDLIVSKVRPNNSQEIIIVIPEIVEEGEEYFEYNSHILIVNNETGKIINKYFESSKTNGWVSDAIQLKEIKIDTAPYNVNENQRAFGVRVYYYGMSRANPYSNETISLFIKSKNSLKNILNNYEVMSYNGEWDTNCAGEFIDHKKTLGIAANKTNSYFDILVNDKVTASKNHVANNGECETEEEVSIVKTTLQFTGKEYKAK